MFVFDNVRDGEEVYQRCLLVTGRCESSSEGEDGDGCVEISTANEAGTATFPENRWPMCQGWFKSLVMLAPGKNLVRFTAGSSRTEMVLHHVPLLQAPPLHLAVMVARDSPLLIDCPPRKYGAVSSAHSSLEAAIAKFRMTAYMWQALTAEELRAAGLGRRSFRLEEEWAVDTLSRDFHHAGGGGLGQMRSTAKIHVIRVDKTVAELRDPDLAQQNPRGRQKDELHRIFADALRAHGAPFLSEARPVVAGMILDSTYDSGSGMILAHAALGAHHPDGLSLGIFGSHLTYAWPRFLEEVPDCLLDVAEPGDRVGNDNGECTTMWEACTVGQGAFLHEVGHAFSAPHTTGIMARGYSRDWAKCFLARTAYSRCKGTEGTRPVTPATEHGCHWDLGDMLRFANFAHFQIPSDGEPRGGDAPLVELRDDDDDDLPRVVVRCEAGIVRASLKGEAVDGPSVSRPVTTLQWTLDELESRLDKEKPLSLEVLGLNGKHSVTDICGLLATSCSIRLPGSTVRLQKKSVRAPGRHRGEAPWPWAVMLKKRDVHGSLVRATKIDLRVGCSLDGAVVYYQDKTTIPCGPRRPQGGDPRMGGHQARKMALPKGVDVVKVGVCRPLYESNELEGLRMWLSNGKAMGALNKGSHQSTVEYLVPDEGHRIIGFYGQSGRHGMCSEFGIVTAPKSRELPDALYDMPELQNSPNGGAGRPAKRVKTSHETDTEDEWDTSEDEDEGYDNESDVNED